MKAYIKDIAYSLPLNIIDNHQLVVEFPEWSVEKIAEKVGINERHVASPDETATDLAVCAAENLFSKGVVDRKSIDFLLFCTQSPD